MPSSVTAIQKAEIQPTFVLAIGTPFAPEYVSIQVNIGAYTGNENGNRLVLYACVLAPDSVTDSDC